MNYMCKDRKKLSNTEQKITKCNKKAFHVEHCKRFTWNIVSVSRGTSQAFHVEHQRRTGEDGKRGERQTTTQRGRSAHRRGRQERRAHDDDAERAQRAQARTAREASA